MVGELHFALRVAVVVALASAASVVVTLHGWQALFAFADVGASPGIGFPSAGVMLAGIACLFGAAIAVQLGRRAHRRWSSTSNPDPAFQASSVVRPTLVIECC